MSDVKWIKITTDIFDDEKIQLIESLPSADSVIVIWFKLLTLAGKQNNCGVFMLNDKIAYTEEMLSTLFRRDITTVRYALDTFQSFGMIDVINGVISLPNWEKHQAIDKMEQIREQNRLRKAKQREKNKLLESGHVTSHADVTQSHATDKDIDIDKDKELDIKREIKEKTVRHKYGEYTNVLLSDEELEKIKAQFPADWKNRIERLSEYIASSGKSYKSHYATILSWARRDAEKKPTQKSSSFDTDDFFEAAMKRSYST